VQVEALRANAGCEYLPQLVASGQLPWQLRESVTHYMVIAPKAKAVDVQLLAPWRVVHSYADVARAIGHMHKMGWVHRCASPAHPASSHISSLASLCMFTPPISSTPINPLCSTTVPSHSSSIDTACSTCLVHVWMRYMPLTITALMLLAAGTHANTYNPNPDKAPTQLLVSTTVQCLSGLHCKWRCAAVLGCAQPHTEHAAHNVLPLH
jgi:hypothetical protein